MAIFVQVSMCKLIEAGWCIYASVNKITIGSDNGLFSAPNHYLNQCWIWEHSSMNFESKFDNFKKNAYENVVCKNGFLSWPQCVKHQKDIISMIKPGIVLREVELPVHFKCPVNIDILTIILQKNFRWTLWPFFENSYQNVSNYSKTLQENNFNFVSRWPSTVRCLWPLLLTWINFNPSMDM